MTKTLSDSFKHEINSLCDRLRLKSPTKHLGFLICSHYFIKLDAVSSILRGREIVLAAVLIASKMRERDIECPTLSTISKAGSRRCLQRTHYLHF